MNIFRGECDAGWNGIEIRIREEDGCSSVSCVWHLKEDCEIVIYISTSDRCGNRWTDMLRAEFIHRSAIYISYRVAGRERGTKEVCDVRHGVIFACPPHKHIVVNISCMKEVP